MPAVTHASSGWSWTNATDATSLHGISWQNFASSESGKFMAATSNPSFDVYTSSDYGATWTNRTTGMAASGSSWSSLTMSANGRYLTAAAQFGDLWTSSDYGATWTNRTTGTALSGLNWLNVVSTPSGQDVVAVDYLYAYLSTDYGATWTKVSSSVGTRSFNNATISSNGQYITAIEDGTNIYGSSDYGATWSIVTSDPSVNGAGWHAEAASRNGQYMVASVFGGDIFTSNNYGQDWTNVTTGTALSGKNWNMLKSSATGQYLVAIESDNLYSSRDYGVTWTNESASPPLSGGSTVDGVAISATGQYITAGTDNGDIYVANDSSLSPTPDLSDQTVSVSVNGSKTVNVLNGVSGVDDSTFKIIAAPLHGTAIGSSGDITYTPTAGYIGTDTITYQVCALYYNTVCSQAVLSFNITPAVPDTGFGPPGEGSFIDKALLVATGIAIAGGVFVFYNIRKTG
jgi:hypothetical protein